MWRTPKLTVKDWVRMATSRDAADQHRVIWENPTPSLLYMIAGNPRTPDVAVAVANHRNTNLMTLQLLMAHPSVLVRTAVYNRCLKLDLFDVITD